MKNFLQPGDSLTVPAPADVASGDGVKVGQMFGVATHDAKSGTDVTLKLTGVFELPKTSAQAWAVGALVYWTGSAATTTKGTNLPIGCAVAVADNPSDTGFVRLNGTAVEDAS